MGFWDTLCPLCGVAPEGGPKYLATTWQVLEALEPIAAELRQLGAGKTLDDVELLDILKGGFGAGIDNHRVLPRGYGSKDYCRTCVGIGYWDENGYFTAYREKNKLSMVPDGREVDVIRLRDADGYGGLFNTVVGEDANGKEKEDCRRVDCDPADSPCIFLCEHCYHYLEAWIDFNALPERSHAFPNESEPLSFAGELYEVINSRNDKRDNDGLMSELEYDGIDNSLDKCQDFVFPGCWKNGRHTALAIDAGLRNEKLLPALMRDSRVWMFMRPNLWPFSPKAPTNVPKFMKFLSGIIPTMATLPLELIVPILADLPVASMLALSSACRYLRTLITNPFFLDRVLREALLRGSLRWILPVTIVPTKENRRARKALVDWLRNAELEGFTRKARPSNGDDSDDGEEPLSKRLRHGVKKKADDDNNDEHIAKSEGEDTEENDNESGDGHEEDDTNGEDPVALMTSPNFPRLAFIRACWDSDSMMNRKRLWGQVKRFEVLWKDYRTNGWQDPKFYPAASINE